MSNVRTITEIRCKKKITVRVQPYKQQIVTNHILHALLPPPCNTSQHYSLRQRTHSFISAQCNYNTKAFGVLFVDTVYNEGVVNSVAPAVTAVLTPLSCLVAGQQPAWILFSPAINATCRRKYNHIAS